MQKAKEKIRAVKVSKSLEKAAMVAKVQLLREQGSSHRDIAKALQMSTATVWNYLKIGNQEVKDIKTVIKRKQMVEDYLIADRARQKLEQGVDKASFRDTVGLWKIARDLQSPRFGQQGTSNAIQININATKGDVSIVNDEVEAVADTE